MLRLIIAACLVTACGAASSARAATAYRLEHAYVGNSDVRKDRLYVRGAKSGRRIVLSRHWGAKCTRAAALNYRLEGGCWYPVRESYPAWRGQAQGWLRVDLRRSLRTLSASHRAFRHRKATALTLRLAKKPHSRNKSARAKNYRSEFVGYITK